MGTRTADCRKFTPNIFNKSKCSHCFRQREEHSAAALECNRVSFLFNHVPCVPTIKREDLFKFCVVKGISKKVDIGFAL